MNIETLDYGKHLLADKGTLCCQTLVKSSMILIAFIFKVQHKKCTIRATSIAAGLGSVIFTSRQEA